MRTRIWKLDEVKIWSEDNIFHIKKSGNITELEVNMVDAVIYSATGFFHEIKFMSKTGNELIAVKKRRSNKHNDKIRDINNFIKSDNKIKWEEEIKKSKMNKFTRRIIILFFPPYGFYHIFTKKIYQKRSASDWFKIFLLYLYSGIWFIILVALFSIPGTKNKNQLAINDDINKIIIDKKMDVREKAKRIFEEKKLDFTLLIHSNILGKIKRGKLDIEHDSLKFSPSFRSIKPLHFKATINAIYTNINNFKILVSYKCIFNYKYKDDGTYGNCVLNKK